MNINTNNNHFQTFLTDKKLLTKLYELMDKKRINKTSELTKLALIQYEEFETGKIDLNEQLANIYSSQQSKFKNAIFTTRPICMLDKQTKDFFRNPYPLGSCINYSCNNKGCLSTILKDLAIRHFSQESIKFNTPKAGSDWRIKFTHDYKTMYERGFFNPNLTQTYGDKFYKIKKEHVEDWLKNQTHALSKTSARQ
jgi:hypothetical protein